MGADDWITAGEEISWERTEFERPLQSENDAKFWLALIAATEAPDVCLMDEDEQLKYLEIERAHGNSLAKTGRYTEASAAYSKALDAVRRTSVYKALFPTERGHMQGAYSRDPGEFENPLEHLSEDEITSRRSMLTALHLNLALCATKEGKPDIARKHSSTVIGAEPGNAKAYFRRGSSSV